MHIYVKHKFQQGTIWNDGILVLFCRVSPQQEQQKQQDEELYGIIDWKNGP